MASRRLRFRSGRPSLGVQGGYFAEAQYPLNGLALIAPFLLAHEIGVAVIGTDLLAHNQLRRFLYQFGATGAHLSAALVVVVLLVWHVVSRRRWRVQGRVVVLMFAESALLSLPLLGISLLGQRLPAAAGSVAGDLLAGLGGGIYEEFLFRLVGLNLLTLLLVDVVELPKDLGYILAVVAVAALFAMYHFSGGRPVDWAEFTFYFLAGCYLSGVYVFRGFGIAVGTHMAYNTTINLLGRLG